MSVAQGNALGSQIPRTQAPTLDGSAISFNNYCSFGLFVRLVLCTNRGEWVKRPTLGVEVNTTRGQKRNVEKFAG